MPPDAMSSTSHPSKQAAPSAPISRRTMLTFSAAAGLGGLCAGYIHLTRPLLTPISADAGPGVSLRSEPLVASKDPLALRHLPDEPWAASAVYVVRNGQSVIYFNTYEPVEENKAIRLEPFAMIFPPKGNEQSEQPMTVAGDAAIMRVQGTIDLTNPDPGRIVSGTVPGEVRLRGPDDLEIHGSNFTFNENAQRLWSDDDVWFRQGENTGRGHGMQLELFRVGEPDDFESVAVSGVRVFRLLRDVEMELILDEGGGGPFAALSGDSTAEAASNGAAAAPEPTHVTCEGAFTFDLRDNIARFDEQVVATRDVPGHEPDRLECDTLEIQFEPATPEAKRIAAERRAKIKKGTLTEDDGFQGVDPNLKATALIAQGHERTATLHSPSNDFVAEFDTLTHDAKTGQTRLDRAGGVIARQKTSKLESPTIILEPSEGDLPPTIICEGRGRLHHRDEQGAIALSVYWAKRLVRARQEDGKDLIRVIGQAQVNQPQEDFRLAGDEIDLWLLPAKPAGKSSQPANAALLDSSRLEPHKLVARDNVMLRSPELSADASLLNVDFVPMPEETLASRPRRGRLVPTSKQIRLAAAEEAVDLPPAPPADPMADRQPSKTAVPAAQSQADAPSTEPTGPIPLEMVAKVINVDMARTAIDDAGNATSDPTNRDAQIVKVNTEGGVVVRQRREDSEPLIIKGDRLELLNRGENQELVHIYGRIGAIRPDGKTTRPKPAQVHDGESDLWGMNIHLNRGENTAWVNGEGILVLPADETNGFMPVDEATAESADSAETPTVETSTGDESSSRLEIRWSERMDFDGKTAIFLGDVRASLNEDDIACQEMQVTLVERIDFASLDNNGEPRESDNEADVATIYCKDRVVVDGGEYKNDTLVARRHAEFSDLRVNNQTGDTRANGPGVIKMWSLGDPKPGEETKNGEVRANSTAQPQQRPWEYTHVKFSGLCEGNIHHLTTTFHNEVWAIFGPVSNHTKELDPLRIDLAPKDAGGMQCEHLTLTRHPATETEPAYSEALAKGNVRITGREFQGNADQVTFDESKDQYILKSFGDHEAVIEMDGRGMQTGQAFTFYPTRNELNIINAQGGRATPQ